MANPGPHDMITCPYNKSHQIEHYRMHIHLQKCRRQAPLARTTAICPFDATHVVSQVEMDYHISVCPKRIMLDSQMYIMDDDARPAVTITSNVAASVDPNVESWEDDNVAPYIPDPSKKGAHMIVKIKGATPSERRKARMEGVRNYRPLE